MKQVPFTIRIDAQTHEQYKLISKELGVPMSKIVREALRSYAPKALEEIESDLRTRLERLRAYQQRDPTFSKAIDRTLQGGYEGRDPLDAELCTQEEWEESKAQSKGNTVDETFSFT